MSARRGPRRRQARRDDRGAVLLLTIVFIVIGSLIVGGLASYTIATLRAMPTARSRTTRVEAVKSAMRIAMTLQRDAGPAVCFDDVSSVTVNDLPVTVSCSGQEFYGTGNDRYGVITTAKTSNAASLTGVNGGSAFVKPLDGKVFLNGGTLSVNTSDLDPNDTTVEMSRYTDANTPVTRYRAAAATADVGCDDPTMAPSDAFATSPGIHSLSCTDSSWYALAGDVDSGGTRQYPLLPQVPTYVRTGSLATIGSCKIFYPGRYLSGGTLTLTGTNYFASGVYYFERPLVVDTNATVVFGEGKAAGCVFDSDAAYAPTAPKSHEITGKGVTLVLGQGATVTIRSGAKVTFNRRVSSASTRGSEGQSIHTVSTGISSATLTVPEDQVKLSDDTTEPVHVHSIDIGTSGQTASYRTSSLGATSTAVSITLGSGSDVTIDGYVFTPQAKVAVTGASGVSNYQLELSGGVVASAVSFNVPTAPSAADGWYVGSRSEVLQRRFDLVATALIDGHTVTSQSSFELREDKTYAINYWTVDA